MSENPAATTPAAPATDAQPVSIARAPGSINVLLVGGGGREHALAWRLRQSPSVGEIYSTDTQNPGIASICQPLDFTFDMRDTFRLQRWCIANRISLAVIGPEEPLCGGLADALGGWEDPFAVAGAAQPAHKHTSGGLAAAVPYVFGPSRAAAQLEGDKAFAKQIMRQGQVPTAEARTFTDFDAARQYVASRQEPPVIKAAGLAKGKGVFVPSSIQEAVAALERILVQREFLDAGKTVLIEERLKGREVSVFALVDGKTIYVLDSAQDHKRLRDGAQGPNTGGMGSICPSRAVDDRMMDRIQREILVPTIDALKREGIEYRGVLYAGIMLTPAGPKVLEFNVRFGDPECQTLMARWHGDLAEHLIATADRKLEHATITFNAGASVCVVLAAEGYPDKPRKGAVIEGLEDAARIPGVQVFHAGTIRNERGLIAVSGGRVLGITATGDTPDDARDRAYAAADKIRFAGKQVRRDIGTDVVG
ncbi:MAG: phosphoribosylamine--glycine ligase [Phycisphaerales bacterium]|jgi:phosphoribosylamine--glycine ligase|nr:phosphoribosylamine--glycine ligase [Phycisphaerales bacterium]